VDDRPEQASAEALARLLRRDPDALTDDELIDLARLLNDLRKSTPDRIGRAVAVLYMRDRVSWPKISERTGIPVGTVFGWARPFLPPDHEIELGPRRGRKRE